MPNQELETQQAIQEIYKALLNITQETSEGLKNMMKALEQLDRQLSVEYGKNAEMKKLAAQQAMTAPTNANAIPNAHVLASGLDNINHQLVSANEKIRELRNKEKNMVFLGVGGENKTIREDLDRIEKSLDSKLSPLIKLNETCVAAFKELVKQEVIAGNRDVAKNVIGEREMNAIDAKVKVWLEEVNNLKNQVKDLHKATREASNDISQSSVPGKLPGSSV